MKYSELSIMNGNNADMEISSRLDSVRSKFMLRRENAFDYLIQKYEKPTQSAVIDIRDYKVVDVSAENASVKSNGASRKEPGHMKISKNEKEELSAIFRIVQSYKTNSENDSYSFCGNSTNEETSSIKSIKIRRKRIIKRLPSTTLKRKVMDSSLSFESNTYSKQTKTNYPVKQCRETLENQDETQLTSTKQRSSKRLILKQITMQRKMSVSREANALSINIRPVRQCRLNATKIIPETYTEDDSDSDFSESLSPDRGHQKKLRKRLTITKQKNGSLECINPRSLHVKKSRKELVSSKGATDVKPPNCDTKPVSEYSSANVPLKKCTCRKTVSYRMQPTRRCKENSSFNQRVICSNCKKKQDSKVSLKDCSVVCERLDDSILVKFLFEKQKASEPVLSEIVSETVDKTNLTSNLSLQYDVSNSDNLNDNMSTDMNIVLGTSKFSSKAHSSINGKTAEVTVSHSYMKNSFVSLSSRSTEQSSRNNGNFSFLNRSNMFITLPRSQKTCLFPDNLSMSISSNSYINKLFNVRKWLR